MFQVTAGGIALSRVSIHHGRLATGCQRGNTTPHRSHSNQDPQQVLHSRVTNYQAGHHPPPPRVQVHHTYEISLTVANVHWVSIAAAAAAAEVVWGVDTEVVIARARHLHVLADVAGVLYATPPDRHDYLGSAATVLHEVLGVVLLGGCDGDRRRPLAAAFYAGSSILALADARHPRLYRLQRQRRERCSKSFRPSFWAVPAPCVPSPPCFQGS